MDFLYDYFISPIINQSGYNLVNTSVFALAFAAVVILTISIFGRFRIKVDRGFFIGLFPFIVLGSVCRSLEDSGALQGFWFVTPGIYLLIYAAALASLSASLSLEKYAKKPYWALMGLMGAVLLLYPLSLLRMIYWQPLALVIAMTSIFAAMLYALMRLAKPRFLSPENSGIILAHLFDASTTFTAVGLSSIWLPGGGYMEQHVLAGFLMGAIGNYAIFLLKLAVIPVALYIIDSAVEDRHSRNFIKLAIFILGFGPGLRNLLSMMLGA